MVKKLTKAWLIIPLSLFLGNTVHFALSEDNDISQIVRVAVFDNISKVTLTVDSPFRIESCPEAIKQGTVNIEKEDANKLLIEASNSGFKIGKDKINTVCFEVKRADKGFINVNGRYFRGSLRFITKDSSNFFVVNYVELEDYIKGVLYHEISHLWPEESIKAQAVVVRTFTLSQKQENKNREFDLTNDTYSQVYGGRTSERWRTNKGVDETKGQILTYKGEIFPTYYHATCGGHTEDASNLWDSDIPPLKGVACVYCADSPHFKWDTYLDFKRLEEKLKAAGLNVNSIKKIEIIERSESNRVLNLKIISDKEPLEISGKQLREIVGPNILRSTNFDIKVESGFVFFDGFGWGHGVGLCQWGAYFMAKKGSTYEEILTNYYPQAKLEKYR